MSRFYKLEGVRERREGSWPVNRTRPTNVTRLDFTIPATLPAADPTSRSRYRSEAWKPAVFSPPSSPPKTDQNADDLARKICGSSHLRRRRFRRSLDVPLLELYSSRHQLSFLTNPATWNLRFGRQRLLESSRLWGHDPPPSPRVIGHRRHHWTHQGL